MSIVGMKSDIYFGKIDDSIPNWRATDAGDEDADDEELAETPKDVVALLGFDPKEFSK